jgi:4-amino-4-deoxy-L-arabinose transferase-like glycosyltransferase
VSGRRGKSKQRQGHPARVASRTPAPQQKARTVQRARPSAGVRPPRRPRKPPRMSALRGRVSSGWQAFLERLPERAPRGASLALSDLSRTDFVWAAATAVASAALFATNITSHPALSDSSEAVAGVASLGILHAPGYPAYVLVARAFTLLIPFGDMAFRVALFSLVCASLSVGCLHLLARRCGAARWAATLAGLCLAASAGYWYYAGFAKHDMFSGLAFMLALYLLLAWEARPTRWRLVALAVVLAVGFGSSWPLEIMLVPAVLFVLVRSRKRISLRSFAVATATGAVMLACIYGFVMVRAAQNPALNWGDATTIGRLAELIERSDFSPPAASGSSQSSTAVQAPTASGGGSSTPSGTIAPARAIATVGTFVSLEGYFKLFWRQLGFVGFLLAAWGALVALGWRRTMASYPLLIAFGGNLLGVAATVGFGSSPSIDDALIEEGFLLGCYFVLACWIAIGATDLIGWLRAPAQRLRVGKSFVTPAVASGLAAVVLIPAVIGNWSVAHRSDNAFADHYAESALAELPHRAALFVWGADLNFPLAYRQIVYHERRDVVVIAIGGLRYGWYRDEVSRALGSPLPPVPADTIPTIVSAIRSVGRGRPVYVDEQASEYLKGAIGLRTVGLVSQVVPGTKVLPVSSPAALDQTLLALERKAGMPNSNWDVWPNSYLEDADYSTLALKVAAAYYEHHDLNGMKAALLNVIRIEPSNSTAAEDLSIFNSSQPAP